MTSKNLRALAKDYANGILAKDAYRKARNELIEGILSGAVEVIPNNYPRTVEHQDLESTGDRTAIFLEREQKQTPSPQPTKPSKQSQPSSQQITSHPWIIGSAAVAIICLIVIVVLFAQRKEIPPPVVIDAAPPTATAELPIPPIQSIKGQQLIEDFLRQNNWSDESLQRFVTDWQAMNPVEQSDGLASPAMTQLKNAIYRQFSEERALLNLGDAEKVIARQNSLAGFAQTLGINDPRLVVEGLETQTTIAMPAEDAVQPIEPAVEETAAIPQVTEPPEPAPIEEKESGPVTATDAPLAETTETVSPATEEPPAPAEIITAPVPAVEEAATKEIPETPKEAPVTAEVPAKTVAQSVTKNKFECSKALLKNRKPYCRDVIDGVGNSPTMVVIAGKKFMMGGGKPHEQPTREVDINYPFALSVHEITNGEYKQFCDAAQRKCPQQPWEGKDYPVVNVSWHDAVAYTTWLTEKTGNKHRLPSEAEWEYAARAGTTSQYPFGDEVLITDAVFSDRKLLNSPIPVTDRSINRNKFRLYHMVGNVREWVTDTWHDGYNGAPNDGSAWNDSGDDRVVRGGSYADNADALRSGARFKLQANVADSYTGFRILQELNE